jgi:hypothetical protein
MDWTEIKERLLREGAVMMLDILYVSFSVISKIIKITNKKALDFPFEGVEFHKVVVPTHYARVLTDVAGLDQCILARPKGFLKKWDSIERKAMPPILADQLFGTECTKEQRKRIVKKIVGLKAFW